MIVPVVPPVENQPADTDHRDLITAIKLLSGQDCVRDASRAQAMILGLTESRHKDVAFDAQSIMKHGLKYGWFEQRIPKYYELKMLAETSIQNHEKRNDSQKRFVMLLLIGLVAFFISGVMAFMLSQRDAALPTYVWTLVSLAVVVLLMAVWTKVQKLR